MKKHLLGLTTFSCLALLSIVSAGNNHSNTKLDLNKEILILSKDNVEQSTLLNDIRSVVGFDYKIAEEFYGIVNGYKLVVNETSADQLSSLQTVEYIGEEKAYIVENSTNATYDPSQFFDSLENNSLKDMNVKEDGKKRGEGTLIAVLDSSFSINHNAFKDLDETTKVRLTKEDIDSFVTKKVLNAQNPSYINKKIPYVWDYGGNISYNSADGSFGTNVEDANVETVNSEHGMHVASIATANGNFTGVAPDAQLAFMKVFADVNGTNQQACLDSMIVRALNDAYTIGADVINMSLGSDLDEFRDKDSASKVAFKKLKEKGVTLSIAAGNSGKGTWSKSGPYAYDTTDIVEQGILGSYSTFDEATVVAASVVSDDDTLGYTYACNGHTFDGYDQVVNQAGEEAKFKVEMPFGSLIPSNQESVAIEYEVVPGLGSENNVDTETGEELGNDYANGLDLTGKIAVIKRGGFSFAEKIANAKKHGAIGVIICNDTGLGSLAYFDLSTATEDTLLPSLSVGKEIGDLLINATGKVITIGKDRMADFSSDGATATLHISPEITTPGQNIAGAVNVVNGKQSHDKYAYLTGTSMATPNFTGVVSALLGSRTFESEEERTSFMKTISARLMTTADPLIQGDGAPYSVRRQGAGLVNFEESLNGLYLTGEGNEGKVELFNNDDVASGTIKFPVTIHNENKTTGEYNAKLSVTIPNTTYLDSETHTDFGGVALQTNKQRLIATHEFKVQLNGEEEQVVNVEYTLTDDMKKDIESLFESGIQVEGFLELKDEVKELPSLSIPYLGFYGDYSKADAVEPFDFERETGKIYQSDLMNSLLHDTGMDSPEANFVSTAVVSTGGLDGVDLNDVWLNKVNIYDKYTRVRTELIDDKYHLYAGAKGFADTLTFVQFVNRSVEDNVIYLKNKNGAVVLEDHMFDNLFGDENNHSLYKSRATIDLALPEGYLMAHRAYTIIPLDEYEDGVYTIEFNYTLLDGSVQTKEYVLHIDSDGKAGTVKEFSINKTLLEFDYDKDIIDVICEGAKDIKFGNGKVSIDLGKLKLTNGICFKVVQSNYVELTGLIERNGRAILLTSELDIGSKFTMTTKSFDNGKVSGDQYTISCFNPSGRKTTLKQSYTILLNADAFGIDENTKVYDVKGTATNSNKTNTLTNKTLAITTKYQTIVISNGEATSTPEQGGGKGGCGGSIIATSVVLSSLALGAGALTFYLKKSKKKENK